MRLSLSTQCLFPLVSRSLEEVLASLVPVDRPVGCKRKSTFPVGREEPLEAAHKSQRLNENIARSFLSREEQDAPAVTGGNHGDVNHVHGHHRGSLDAGLGSPAPGLEDVVVDQRPERVPCSAEAFNPLRPSCSPERLQPPRDLLNTGGVLPELPPRRAAPGASEVGGISQSPRETLNPHSAVVGSRSFRDEAASWPHAAQLGHASFSARRHFGDIEPGPEDDAGVEEAEASDLLPLPGRLFWCNRENLCWLDSVLVALVNCRSLKRCRPAAEPQRSSIWRLIGEYQDICAAVQGRRQSGGGTSGTELWPLQ